MYVGNVRDFFYKSRFWLENQPKITKENKFQYMKLGGKLFKLNIFTGELFETNKSYNKVIYENKLKSKRSNKDESLKRNKKILTISNINIYKNNKKEIKIPLKEKNILNKLKEKKTINKLSTKRNKSSNINTNFSLASRSYKNNSDLILNIYLNKKYIYQGIDKIRKRNNNTKFEKHNFLTFNNINKKEFRTLSYNYPKLKVKKVVEDNNDSDSDNFFIHEDVCEIKKEDNGITTSVKNRIFKDKMFKKLQKKYNFFKDNKISLFNIPKLKLDTAQHIFVDKKESFIKKLYLK